MATLFENIPKEVLNAVSGKTEACLSNLVKYLSSLEHSDFPSYPKSKLAAVLVLLYEQDGLIRVVLTTRSKELRTHAGQTALPGGKKDPVDVDSTATALREAHEEVALPPDCPFVHILGTLEPYLSLHKLLVTPVIAFVSQPDVVTQLRPSLGEVALIFSHPLEALLDPTLAKSDELVPIGSEDWPYDSEFHNISDEKWEILGNIPYRMHRFRTSASPIGGMTADILIEVAEATYGKSTPYERYAPQQLHKIQDIIDIVQPQPSTSTCCLS